MFIMTESVIERNFFKEIVEKAQKELGVTFEGSSLNTKACLLGYVKVCLLKAKVVLIAEKYYRLEEFIDPLQLLEESSNSLKFVDELLHQFKELRKFSETFLEELKQEEGKLLELRDSWRSFDKSIPFSKDERFKELFFKETAKISSLREEFGNHKEFGDQKLSDLFLSFTMLAFSNKAPKASSEEIELFEKRLKEAISEKESVTEIIAQMFLEIDDLNDVLLI